jgi:hypothetical protein
LDGLGSISFRGAASIIKMRTNLKCQRDKLSQNSILMEDGGPQSGSIGYPVMVDVPDSPPPPPLAEHSPSFKNQVARLHPVCYLLLGRDSMRSCHCRHISFCDGALRSSAELLRPEQPRTLPLPSGLAPSKPPNCRCSPLLSSPIRLALAHRLQH